MSIRAACSSEGRAPMRNPDPREIAAVAVPIFIAEAVVAVALFLGTAVTVQGHVLWTLIVGLQ